MIAATDPKSKIQNPKSEFWLAALLSLVGALVFLAPGLLDGKVPSAADMLFNYQPWMAEQPAGWVQPHNDLLYDSAMQFEPWLSYAAAELHAGRLPLWNPDNYLGAPLVGNLQSALFFPLNWPYLAFPGAATLLLRILLKIALTLWGTYLLARFWPGVRPFAAALAAIGFAFSAYNVVWIFHPHTNAAMLLPWLLLATLGLLRQPGLWRFAALALVVALLILAGHPETTYHVLLVGGVFAVFYALTAIRVSDAAFSASRLARLLGLWGLACLLGAGLAAVQLLPFLEYSALSRASQIRVERQFGPRIWLEFRYAWTLISPDMFGSPVTRNWWVTSTNYNETAGYSGMLTLLLVPLAFLKRERRAVAIFLGAVAFVAACVIYNAPLIPELVLLLPGMRLLFNTRLLLVVDFALALLAAVGADALLSLLTERLRAVVLTLAVTLAGLLLAAVAVPALFGAAFFGAPEGNAQAILNGGIVRAGVALLISGGVLAVLVAGSARRKAATAAPFALLPLLLLLDLWLAHANYIPSVAPGDLFPGNSALAMLQQQAGQDRFVAAPNILMSNTNLAYGLADIHGYDALIPLPYYALMTRGESATPELPDKLRPSRLWDLLGVRYILTQPGDDPNDPAKPSRFVLRYSGPGEMSIWANTSALPRAWLVHNAETVDAAPARLNMLLDPTFDPRATAILSEPRADLNLSASAGADDRVSIVGYQSDRVEITSESGAAGLLILSDVNFPGWHASVDGVPAPIISADEALRAVYLPAGSHRVVYSYDPLPFRQGAIISLVALVVLAGLLLWPLLRGKKTGVAPGRATP